MHRDWLLPQRLIGVEPKDSQKETEAIRRFPVIGVVGPLGAGKSTLSRILELHLDVPSYPVRRFTENYPDNEFLPFMFEGKAYESEVVFLRSKMEQLKDARDLSLKNCLVIDPSAEGDCLFAYAIMKMGWMSRYKFGRYMEEYVSLRDGYRVLTPDIFVVVNAEPEVLRQRIAHRIEEDPGRTFERKILTDYPEYLGVLSGTVESFAQSVRGIKPVINIDSARWDFVSTPGGKYEVAAEVLNWVNYYTDAERIEKSGNFASDGAELIAPNFRP